MIKELQDAIATIDTMKDELHEDRVIEHTPVLTFMAIEEHKDRYEACTCWEDLWFVKQTLLKAIKNIDLLHSKIRGLEAHKYKLMMGRG